MIIFLIMLGEIILSNCLVKSSIKSPWDVGLTLLAHYREHDACCI